MKNTTIESIKFNSGGGCMIQAIKIDCGASYKVSTICDEYIVVHEFNKEKFIKEYEEKNKEKYIKDFGVECAALNDLESLANFLIQEYDYPMESVKGGFIDGAFNIYQKYNISPFDELTLGQKIEIIMNDDEEPTMQKIKANKQKEFIEKSLELLKKHIELWGNLDSYWFDIECECDDNDFDFEEMKKLILK